MTDALKDLIHDGDWLGIAKAITLAYVDAPVNPKKFAWVSAVEEGPYHIETNDSAANGGQGFKAICGVAGDFNHHLKAAQIFPSQKCKSCIEISDKQVLDVASQQEQPTKAVNHESGTGEVRLKTGDGCARKPLTNTNSDTHLIRQNSIPYMRGDAVSPAAPLDRHGDDRFADNILRACEGLPQHGDDLEEIDAAEEGDAIEASGYMDPATNPRFA